MNSVLDEKLLVDHGISGIICNDADGLCLGAAGVVADNSGSYAAVADGAALLAAQAGEPPPVVLIETDKRNIILKKYNKLTVAVYKDTEGGRR
eukprot:CAMPEP_0113937336 /NCGR_PEP_ID=MMETSP1339-20121228/3977_1 /TAXON_ID=94617 /ORGANISM="Fibrocapsa japonica" /LENGTH=92 /DNA_ID=CAMNT_0000940059 /DNA_START=66 /DNA_END=344 /DNA_ORIENTATION=+ /assembly_acc=CAM_ASM_000762